MEGLALGDGLLRRAPAGTDPENRGDIFMPPAGAHSCGRGRNRVARATPFGVPGRPRGCAAATRRCTSSGITLRFRFVTDVGDEACGLAPHRVDRVHRAVNRGGIPAAHDDRGRLAATRRAVAAPMPRSRP